MLDAIAAVELVIGDQHLHDCGAGRRLKILVDHPGTQQQFESYSGYRHFMLKTLIFIKFCRII